MGEIGNDYQNGRVSGTSVAIVNFSRLVIVSVLCTILVLVTSCSSSGGAGENASMDESAEIQGTVATLSTDPFIVVPANETTVGAQGGTITPKDSSGSLNGLLIEVPPGATEEEVSFKISYATITESKGLPSGVILASKAIIIETIGSESWNNEKMFNLPVKVTLPFLPQSEGDDTVRYYLYSEDGSLEPAGFELIDLKKHLVTFYTRTFSNSSWNVNATDVSKSSFHKATSSSSFGVYVAYGLGSLVNIWSTNGKTIDTGFLPSKNGWYLPNYGSYYKESRGGNCFGFVGAAKYYYKNKYFPNLYDNYRDSNNTPTWIDDSAAIEFTSRVHNGMAAIWSKFVNGELNQQKPSSSDVALSYLGGMVVSGLPVLLYIQQTTINSNGSMMATGAHAIMVYRADITNSGHMTFHVYDPNYPNDDTRRINFTPPTFGAYYSGTNAANSNFTYNYFTHVGYSVGLSDSVLHKVKSAADQNFTNASLFPEIKITSITGTNNLEDVTQKEGITQHGEHKYMTSDTSVRIQGTILGGLAQDPCCIVDNANIYISNNQFTASANNSSSGGDGSFDITVPIAQGENDFVIIASDKAKKFEKWAGFYRNVIESTASPASLTITLTWEQAGSDVDLYVKEPAEVSRTGDTVYYKHRRGFSDTNPYLDIDNREGFGPEHYIAMTGMKTLYSDSSESKGLYGEYLVKVHYFEDHTKSQQPVTWTVDWRYLAFCQAPCFNSENTGFWVTGSKSGTLMTANDDSCCDIDHTGDEWSEEILIPYLEPDPQDYNVPNPSAVMLP